MCFEHDLGFPAYISVENAAHPKMSGDFLFLRSHEDFAFSGYNEPACIFTVFSTEQACEVVPSGKSDVFQRKCQLQISIQRSAVAVIFQRNSESSPRLKSWASRPFMGSGVLTKDTVIPQLKRPDGSHHRKKTNNSVSICTSYAACVLSFLSSGYRTLSVASVTWILRSTSGTLAES